MDRELAFIKHKFQQALKLKVGFIGDETVLQMGMGFQAWITSNEETNGAPKLDVVTTPLHALKGANMHLLHNRDLLEELAEANMVNTKCQFNYLEIYAQGHSRGFDLTVISTVTDDVQILAQKV